MSRLLACTLVLGSLTLAGCGSKEPFQYMKMTGSVTYEDGSLIQGEGCDQLEVTFYSQVPPKDAKTHPRPATAIVNVADGKFTEITSHKPNDGIIPGEHKVTVQTFDKTHSATQVLPPEYMDVNLTPLRADTKDPSTFQIKVKKKM